MKLWHYIVGAGMLLCIGYLLGYYTRGEVTVTVQSVDTTIVKEFIVDTTQVCDTIVFHRRDTLFITEDTPIGDIPLRTTDDRDSIPVRVGDATMYVPYDLSIMYRGLLYKYYLTTHPRPYNLTLPKPREKLLAPYVAATVSLDIQKRLLSEIESGIDIKHRVQMFIRYQADSLDVFNGEFRAGCRVVLK